MRGRPVRTLHAADSRDEQREREDSKRLVDDYAAESKWRDLLQMVASGG
jgi:hypothetical protein